ncbi:hypothetical protein ACQJBY_008849 [Aegilops geniculata]
MAEMVSSAVVEETLNQIVSGLIDRHEERPEQTEQMERLEMAHIKLAAALETSGKWQINDASLLRWRHKLKRAARECDVALRKCKQRAVEDEEKEEEVRSSSFPRRLAHATRSFVAGFFRRDTGGGAAVRRFEWFADGANEFLRFVELGGTPRGYTFFDPLIGRLLAGQELRYRLVRGSQYHLFCVRPISFEDRGVEAKMLFVYEDDEAPEKNLCLGSILRLSESTDVVGITMKCLQLVTPHFRSTAESARKELAGLPTQDFSWVPYLDSGHKDHWNSIHSSLTQWFRPNPLCCKQQHDELQPCSSGGTARATKLSDVSLEPVIEVFLQRHIPLSEYSVHRSESTVQGERGCLKDVPHLKLGLLFSPHGSSEDLVPAVESSAIEVIDGEKQSGMHTNISLEQLDEVMLPKAIDCLYKRPEATAYQMFWKSKHGTAFLQVEKTSLVKMPPTKIGEAGARRLAIQRRRDPKLERWIQVVIDFLNLWVAHAPPQLRSSFIEWIHKANEMKQAPQQRPTTY